MAAKPPNTEPSTSIEHRIRLSSANLHYPLDHQHVTRPPAFPPAVYGHGLPVPPDGYRRYPIGEPIDRYLESGLSDAARVQALAAAHMPMRDSMSVLDFGCATGRVLRHFDDRWRKTGVDLDAVMIDWLRRHWPLDINVFTGHALPHLPLPDRSLDLVYAISVFPHLKYHWDSWLMEWRRVLRPGGLCIITAQCEDAWRYYHARRHEPWVIEGHPADLLAAHAELPDDYLLIGDAATSQTFFARAFLEQAVKRSFHLAEWAGLAPFGYQDWLVLQKTEPR